MKPSREWNENMAQILRLYKCILGPLGIWPPVAQSLSGTFCWIVSVSIVMVTIGSICIEIFRNCRGTQNTIDALLVGLSSFLSLSKIVLHRYNWRFNHFLVQSMLNDWSKPKSDLHRDIMMTFVERSRFVSYMLFYMILTSGVAFVSTNLPADVLPSSVSSMMFYDNDTGRKFIYPNYCLFERSSSRTYYLVFSMQIVQVAVQVISHSGNDGFFFVITMHLCSQFKILNMEFATLKADRFNWQKQCGRLVRRHKQLSLLADNLESAFNMIVLAQLLSSVMLLCISGFQLITCLKTNETFVAGKSAFTIISLLLQLFFFTFAADLFEQHTRELSYAVYDCKWYDFDAVIAKDLPLIILRGSVPHRLTAGKFLAMNLLTFQSVLKASASYLSVMRMLIEV